MACQRHDLMKDLKDVSSSTRQSTEFLAWKSQKQTKEAGSHDCQQYWKTDYKYGGVTWGKLVKAKTSKLCSMESQRNAAKRKVKVTGWENHPCGSVLGGQWQSSTVPAWARGRMWQYWDTIPVVCKFPSKVVFLLCLLALWSRKHFGVSHLQR